MIKLGLRMSYKNFFILASIFIIAGCTNHVVVKPNNYYLPEANIGRPYKQIIYLQNISPETLWVASWPEHSGLHWQFSRDHSSYWNSETKEGDAIEIIGTPNDNNLKKIKIGILGFGSKTLFDGRHIPDAKADFYKEYMVKLIQNVPSTSNP